MSQMSKEQLSALRDQLQVLRNSYGQKLAEKTQDIKRTWQDYLSLGVALEKKESLILLHRLLHTVAGSGATFGFKEVGDAARSAELKIKPWLEGDGVLDSSVLEEVTGALKTFFSQSALSPPGSGMSEQQVESSALEGNTDEEPGEMEARRVLLLTDQPLPPLWSSALCAFGYDLRVCYSPAELVQAATEGPTSLIIADCAEAPLLVRQDGLPLSAALDKIQRECDETVPVIWTCSGGDIGTRIQAVRLGGSAFFTHPVDADALLVKMDDLTANRHQRPFRVLIVDDEPALGRLFSLILKQAGMFTHVVHRPLEVMSHMVDFRPDIVLMDVYMPDCSGVELASVIRQQEAYVSIPIVFLSVESDVLKQLEAMRQGGDDFLMKPVQPRQLVTAVATRATRARVLQHLMHRDSLTGLLNHTKTKEQLEIELDRARRVGHPLALAMLDIDHFKLVNDTHGHATGDRVLRSLSRLLLQKLRQTDVIGRYGGEEFCIIMSGTDKNSAARVMEKVRHSFACLKHWNEGQEFKVTFSVGIATAPPHTVGSRLSEAADQALYQAKRSGRNKVVVADDSLLLAARKPL